MVEDDHAEDAAEGTKAGGESKKVALRDAESVLLGLFLIRMEKRKSDEVHQEKKDHEHKAVLIQEFENKLHLRLRFIPRPHYTANIGFFLDKYGTLEYNTHMVFYRFSKIKR